MDEELEQIARDVVDASMKLHMSLGPGLLINFGEQLLKNGIKRLAN